jgi:hypothetical protein
MGKMRLNEGWSAKVGRAVLSYNQQLLLGNTEGVKFTGGQPSGMPQYAAPPEDNILNYKTMQFIGLNKTWASDNWSGNNVLSFLFTNSGYQYTAGGAESNMQTTGIYGWFPMGDLTMEANAYYQFGAYYTMQVQAYQLHLKAEYLINDDALVGAGVEMIGGSKAEDYAQYTTRSFIAQYGTNQRFNGFMESFYVGSLYAYTGLNDYFAKLHLQLTNDSYLLLMPHVFTKNVAYTTGDPRYLGTEIDCVYNCNLSEDVTLTLGYSHLLPSKAYTTSLTGVQNWAYAGLYLRPSLFVRKKNTEKITTELK